MESIIATITSLLGTLLGYVQTLAAQFGLDTYLDSILSIFGLGGETGATETPAEER